MVGGDGFEPPKAEPVGLQPTPFDRSGNRPNMKAWPGWSPKLPLPVKPGAPERACCRRYQRLENLLCSCLGWPYINNTMGCTQGQGVVHTIYVVTKISSFYIDNRHVTRGPSGGPSGG